MHTPSSTAARDSAEPLRPLLTPSLSAGCFVSSDKAPSSLDVMGVTVASVRGRPRQLGGGGRGGVGGAGLGLREAETLGHDVDRTAFHLAIHARDVLADDAERKQLD